MKLVAIIAFLTLISCTSVKRTNPAINNALSYYAESYCENRERLKNEIERLKGKLLNIEWFSRKISSKSDTANHIDCIYLPALKKNNSLIIITTGIHGAESYWGNAVVLMIINELLPHINLDEIGILFICNINPFGAKHFRRHTEGNIDLNRNMVLDTMLFRTPNPSADKMYNFLTPKKKLKFAFLKDEFFFVTTLYNTLVYGPKTLINATTLGQYKYPESLCYGGQKTEEQVGFLDSLITTKIEPYKGMFLINLHTAYGKKGNVHYWGTRSQDSNLHKITNYVFNNYPLISSKSTDYYTLNGTFESFIEKKFHPQKICLASTFEAGTLNTHTLSGVIKLLNYSVIENQAFHYGCNSPKDSLELRKRVLEMYYPVSTQWRQNVLIQTKSTILDVIHRFNEYVSKTQYKEEQTLSF